LSRPPPSSTPFPYTTLFRSGVVITLAGLMNDGQLILSLGQTIHRIHESSIDWQRALAAARNEQAQGLSWFVRRDGKELRAHRARSEEHTSELQSRGHLVCRL